MTNAALQGNPDAGGAHVAPLQCYGGTSRRGALLYRRVLTAVAALLAASLSAAELDRVALGETASEAAHGFSDGGTSYVETGASSAACRRIKRPDNERWRAGPMRFRLKVASEGRTYLTVQLWGGDVSHDHLFCTVDGKMLGQMHLGEYDLLDYESCWPRDSNRDTADAEHFGVFTYRTFLLPESLTRGKESVEIAIYAAGHVWGYGRDFGQFQKMVANDSRGIYSAVTHTTPFGGPTRASVAATPRPAEGKPAARDPDLAGVEKGVDGHLEWLMKPGVLAGRIREVGLLAEAYNTEWCLAYRKPEAVQAIAEAVDAEAEKERNEPGSVCGNGTWTGAGDTAQAVVRLGADALAPLLTAARRQTWREHFLKSVEYLSTHRRYFANQSQIVDTNAHWSNRALKLVDPLAGPPLAETLEHVKEAMGLRPMPTGYVALTAAGLSKEDGYVGSYGESTIWASANAYEASDGDEELLAQLKKASRARLYMRYPGVRRDGRRVARLEAQVSWRNEHFPPPPTYLTNGGDLRNAVLARDPVLVGAIRDAYEDGSLADFARGLKADSIQALRFPGDWRKVKSAIDKFGDRLPHMPCFGEDFVWCDPENAVAVVKRGPEMLFVEAYWRARGGINNLAKVHYVSPKTEIVATVFCEETYEQKDGKSERIGEWFQYGWMDKLYGGYRESFAPDEGAWPPSNATAGALRPVAANGGRAEFYIVRYGPYIVAINDSHHGRSYDLDVPDGAWTVLPSGARAAKGRLSIAPKSCVVVCNEIFMQNQ